MIFFDFEDSDANINGIEVFRNQVKQHQQKFNGVPKHHFQLFLKDCEWRFNGGSPKELLRQLRSWITLTNKRWPSRTAPLAKLSRQRSRSIAIALALLAVVGIMYFVTIVKLEEQVHRDELPQTWEETKQPPVLTSDFTVYARRDALAWASGNNVKMDTPYTKER